MVLAVPPFLCLPIILPFLVALAPGRELHDDKEMDVVLQPFWSYVRTHWGETISHFLFPSVLGLASFILTCIYFTIKDVTKDLRTKTQPDHFPTNQEILGAAVPQLAIYLTANTASWFLFPWRTELPVAAPSLGTVALEVFLCYICSDMLIYIEHRVMHIIPFLRNHIHSVHHAYHYPFSWAGGWVHPLEDAVVIMCVMVFPLYTQSHPISIWIFVSSWVAFLIEEHSGHDVWWSLWLWLPFSMGGGAVPHDIHHVRPLKNFGFVFTVWDQICGTYEAPALAHPAQSQFQSDATSLWARVAMLAMSLQDLVERKLEGEPGQKEAGGKQQQAMAEKQAMAGKVGKQA